jgi:hypothetical protein
MMKVHLKTTKENGYTQMTGMTANSQTTGSDMEWQILSIERQRNL